MYGKDGIVGSTSETFYETVLESGEYYIYVAAWNGGAEPISTSELVPFSIEYETVQFADSKFEEYLLPLYDENKDSNIQVPELPEYLPFGGNFPYGRDRNIAIRGLYYNIS